MPFVAAPNTVEVAVIARVDGESVENTFHFKLAAPATLSDLQDMAAIVDTQVATWNSLWSTLTDVEKYYLRALDSSSAPSYEQNPASPITGTQAANPLPNDVSFALTRYTGLAGRAHRGRIYLFGLYYGALTEANTIKQAVADDWVTTLNLLDAAMLAGPPAATEVILHRATGTTTDVIGWRWSDLIPDNQRRRLPGHNRHR